MNGFFHLKFKPNNLAKNQFKIVVSLKVSKKAVVRNKIKRRIREVLKQLDIKQGYDIVIITHNEILGKNFIEIKNAIAGKISKLLNC